MEHFCVTADIRVRFCRAEDLPALEWFGLFTEHRAIIQAAFAAQERGDALMVLADLNGFPVGQVWINLTRRDAGAAGLWAVRVLPCLQGLGIGGQLMGAAEKILRERGFSLTELGVEKANAGAIRFYERLGYRISGEDAGVFEYTTPDGITFRIPQDEWIMQKDLTEGA